MKAFSSSALLSVIIYRSSEGLLPHHRLSSGKRHDSDARIMESQALEKGSLEADRLFDELRINHEREIERGYQIFGRSIQSDPSFRSSSFSDDDCESVSVGIGNAGPTEGSLQKGYQVYRTKNPIVSAEECQSLVNEAQEIIAKNLATEVGEPQPSRERTNAQLNEAKMSDLPLGNLWLKDLLQTKLFPILESRFDVDASKLTLNDALVIGYIGPSRSQPIHRDSSVLSLQIALSPTNDFTGGGTYFEAFDDPVMMEQGHVLCHSSGLMHAGRGVDSGERWILVLFVLSEDEPQLAKRCHSEGVIAMDDGDIERAERFLKAGLEVAPSDHLLSMSLSNCLERMGKKLEARRHLETAQIYELDPKACMSHARILQSLSRPRAALRRLNKAIDRLDGKDLRPGSWVPLRATGWELRVQAARCACLCAEREWNEKDPSERTWTRKHLPTAVDRLETSLLAAPGHAPLQGMLDRANELLYSSQVDPVTL